MASSAWGEARQTNDIDIVLYKPDIELNNFLEAMREPLHVSRVAVEDALESTEEFPSFQILQMDEAIQFDCFPAHDPFSEDCLTHRVFTELDGFSLPVASAEHIFIQKLRWFRLGNHKSQVQWRDLVALLAMNPELSSSATVQHWINHFNLQPELEIIQSDLP